MKIKNYGFYYFIGVFIVIRNKSYYSCNFVESEGNITKLIT